MKVYSGFTLIELMVVVAIVAILAAIAVPSYQAHVQAGRRAEGKAFALDVASRQERFFTQTGNYATGAGFDTSLNLPNGTASENDAYTATVGDNGGNGYLITVTPAVADAECGNLILDNTGARDVSTSSDRDFISDCWR